MKHSRKQGQLFDKLTEGRTFHNLPATPEGRWADHPDTHPPKIHLQLTRDPPL